MEVMPGRYIIDAYCKFTRLMVATPTAAVAPSMNDDGCLIEYWLAYGSIR